MRPPLPTTPPTHHRGAKARGCRLSSAPHPLGNPGKAWHPWTSAVHSSLQVMRRGANCEPYTQEPPLVLSPGRGVRLLITVSLKSHHSGVAQVMERRELAEGHSHACAGSKHPQSWGSVFSPHLPAPGGPWSPQELTLGGGVGGDVLDTGSPQPGLPGSRSACQAPRELDPEPGRPGQP